MNDKQNDLIYRRFKGKKIKPDKLYEFLEKNDFFPDDIGDYGQVPRYYRYYDEFDTTVYLLIEPRINSHHTDDLPRSIDGIAFNEKESGIFANRKKLSEVNPILLDILISEIDKII